MKRMKIKTIFSMATAIMILLVVSAMPAMAWGGLTHYSIDKDAGKNSNEELSAANGPDAFYYYNSSLGYFVHQEDGSPNILYGPLGIPLVFVANNDAQKRWGTGWMTHTTADRSAHGHSNYYPNNDNYIKTAGGDHQLAEYGGDILSFWYNQGTSPLTVSVNQYQVRDALELYDGIYGTSYATNYDPVEYVNGYTNMHATNLAEEASILAGAAPLLSWAYLAYNNAYDTYYPQAISDVQSLTRYGLSVQSLQLFESSITQTTSEVLKNKNDHEVSKKIQMEVGKRLIDEELLIPHKELDTKTGVVTISFEQTVSNKELAKAYYRYFDDASEKHTGRRAGISEIIDRTKGVTVGDIKKDYPELYQKLIEKGRIDKSGNLIGNQI